MALVPFGEDSNESNAFTFDLGSQILSARMKEFSSELDRYISRNQKKIINDKNQLTMELSELKETQKRLKSEIDTYRKKDQELEQLRMTQKQEIEASRETISNFTQKMKEMEHNRTTLLNAIEEARISIQQRKEEQQKQREIINKQMALINPELSFWETTLGLHIEGVKDDVLRFVFTNIDPNNYSRPFSCTLDLSEQEYKVIKCSPELSTDVLNPIIKSLNISRNVCLFLKQMWKAFKNKATENGTEGS